MTKRAVITGVGLVTSVGIGKENFWESVLGMESGVDKVSLFDAAPFPAKIAAEVKNFNPEDHMPARKAATMDRSVQFAVAAARMASADAGLDISEENESHVHVIMGTAIGGLIWVLKQEENFLQKGLELVHAYSASVGMANSCSAEISIALGARGASETFSVGCSSSHSAMGYALKKIRSGEAKVAVVGGTDAPIYPLPFGSLCVMNLLSTRNADPKRACRPFDEERDGLVLGEGSAVLIVEELEHAASRGASVYAEVAGFGATCDAYHIVNGNHETKHASNALKIAIKDAGIDKSDISYINAHGLAAKKSDAFEAEVLKSVFSAFLRNIPVVSIKSMIGHPLAAAGAIQFATTALSIKNGTMPATLNHKKTDASLDLNVNREVVKTDIGAVACNSFAFGGKNNCVVLKKFKKV